jgi:hypothetical protein
MTASTIAPRLSFRAHLQTLMVLGNLGGAVPTFLLPRCRPDGRQRRLPVGAAVNLASRIQALNKDFGTRSWSAA